MLTALPTSRAARATLGTLLMFLLLPRAAVPAGPAEPGPRTVALGEPESGVVTVPLRELWRAGGEDSDVFFGNVLQVLDGPAGSIRVLDSQLLQVFVFDRDGGFGGTLGGRGEGPGEVSNVNSIIDLGDGVLGLGQVLPGKLVTIAADGTPLDTIVPSDPGAPDGGLVLLLGGHAAGSGLALLGMRWSFEPDGMLVQNMFYRRYDAGGRPGPDICTKRSVFDAAHFVFTESGFDFVWSRCGLLPDGRAVTAPARGAYEIRIDDGAGRTALVLTRACDPWRRSADERREAELTHEAIGSHYGRRLEGVQVEDTEPAITALHVGADGLLRVRTGRGDRVRAPGILTTVDVVTADGRYLRREQLQCPGDPRRDGIHLLADGRLVVVTGAVEAYRREQSTTRSGADETPLEVVCYGPAD